MKKVTYNVFYKPVMECVHWSGKKTKLDLGLFTEEADAQIAMNLMYGIQDVLSKGLLVKLDFEHCVEEIQILETEQVPYYNNLKEFAAKNSYMQYYLQKEGAGKLNRMVDNAIGRYHYMVNE